MHPASEVPWEAARQTFNRAVLVVLDVAVVLQDVRHLAIPSIDMHSLRRNLCMIHSLRGHSQNEHVCMAEAATVRDRLACNWHAIAAWPMQLLLVPPPT